MPAPSTPTTARGPTRASSTRPLLSKASPRPRPWQSGAEAETVAEAEAKAKAGAKAGTRAEAGAPLMPDGTGGCSRFDCALCCLEAQPGRADDAWRTRTLTCVHRRCPPRAKPRMSSCWWRPSGSVRGRRFASTMSLVGGAAPTGATAARLRRRGGAKCYSRRCHPRAESRSSTVRHRRCVWCRLRNSRIAPLLRASKGGC